MTGLITINDNNNYGNRLQNYASYVLLSKHDKTFNIIRKYGCETKNFPYGKELFLKTIARWFVFHLKRLFPFQKAHALKTRHNNFIKFNKLMNNGEKINYKTNYHMLCKKYDKFIIGSDQVWNPTFPGNGMFINMLGFCHDSQKKYSLASSVSIENLSEKQQKEFKNFLSDFQMISCREKQGSDLIEKLINRKVTTLSDPTLVIDANHWRKISSKPKKHNSGSRYILTYFLGEKIPSYKTIVDSYQNKYGYQVINLNDINDRYYSSGPAEFLWLIDNCEILLTDSYHGAIFAYLFEKPLKIFERISDSFPMNSRLVNLAKTLNLREDVFVSNNPDDLSLNNLVCDKNTIKCEKDKFSSFLSLIYTK